MTQREAIYDYMLKNEEISDNDARREFGCNRLGARIWDLRHRYGISIIGQQRTTKNRWGKNTRPSFYRLPLTKKELNKMSKTRLLYLAKKYEYPIKSKFKTGMVKDFLHAQTKEVRKQNGRD